MDRIGQKFGRLTIIKKAESDKKRKTSVWRCKCECGNEKEIAWHDIKNGTKSCGCLAKESKKENMRTGRNKKRVTSLIEVEYNENTRLSKIHQGMKSRCYNTNNSRWKNYGGKGIKICEKWLYSYEEFKKWSLANGYKEGLTIERIDVDGNYNEENCKWITNKAQQRNKTNNHYVTIEGKTKTISEWSEITGIKQNTILYRIKRGKKGNDIIKGVNNGR